MKPIAVFDIDGVLADVRHRLTFVENKPKQWNRFFEAAKDDEPLAEGFAILSELRETHELVFLTGRPEKCRAQTEAWLTRYGVEHPVVHMRRPGNFTPSAVEKLALLTRLASEGRELAVIYDDDPSVVAAYREAGFNVVHATWVPYGKALREAQQQDGQV